MVLIIIILVRIVHHCTGNPLKPMMALYWCDKLKGIHTEEMSVTSELEHLSHV